MTRVEIPPERWAAKLDEFTRVHEWALVSIDIWTAGQGKRREVANLPLLGVSANRPGTDRTVLMSVACAGDGHITHVVHRRDACRCRADDERRGLGAPCRFRGRDQDGPPLQNRGVAGKRGRVPAGLIAAEILPLRRDIPLPADRGRSPFAIGSVPRQGMPRVGPQQIVRRQSRGVRAALLQRCPARSPAVVRPRRVPGARWYTATHRGSTDRVSTAFPARSAPSRGR